MCELTNLITEFDYIDEAQQVLPDRWFGEFVSRGCFHEVLDDAITALKTINYFKGALFDGKGILNDEGRITVPAFPTNLGHLSAAPFNQHIILAILGKAVEAGALLQMLQDWIREGGQIDQRKLMECVGDGMRYDAILAKECRFNFGDAQLANIVKLRKLYPSKFKAYDAKNAKVVAAEQRYGEDLKPWPNEGNKALCED